MNGDGEPRRGEESGSKTLPSIRPPAGTGGAQVPETTAAPDVLRYTAKLNAVAHRFPAFTEEWWCVCVCVCVCGVCGVCVGGVNGDVLVLRV